MAASPLSWWNTDSERCQCQAVSYCFISSQPSDISSSIQNILVMTDWDWEEDSLSLTLNRDDADCLKIFRCCWVRMTILRTQLF